MVFRTQSKHIGLTYPTCTLPKHDIFQYLQTITIGSIRAEKVLVVTETHEDGQPHIHAYVGLNGKPNITDETLFDYKTYHPNIQGLRSAKDWIRYICKEDVTPVANFNYDFRKPIEFAWATFRDSIDHGKSELQCINDAIDADPSLLRNYSSLSGYFQRTKRASSLSVPHYDLASFSLPLPFKARICFFKTTISEMERGTRIGTHSMWFVGPSLCGKTSLARSIGDHWYMCNAWNITKINDADNAYGVIDDVNWNSIQPYYKSVLGRQKDVTFTDKYVKKLEFKFGRPVIICSNELPIFSDHEIKWLKLNVEFFKFCYPIQPNKPIKDIEYIKL
jgi:hypothetical protein